MAVTLLDLGEVTKGHYIKNREKEILEWSYIVTNTSNLIDQR